jgi:glycosyltransferase involved in cell wall biosynthesis
LRIAQVAPLQLRIPPYQYGGIERVISNLTDALVHRGHDVTLFATGDSHTAAKLSEWLPYGVNFDPGVDISAHHISLLTEVYRQADEFDIIHSHLEHLTLPFAANSKTASILTLHYAPGYPEFARALSMYNAHYVAISHHQSASQPELSWAGVVYSGINVNEFPFYPEPGDYLAFVGRITPKKRPDYAIEIAQRAHIPLKIAAQVHPKHQRYFERSIAPLLDSPLIEFLGEVDEPTKRELMGHALALLLPIDWPEPFGMVFIEALACGTPVISRPCGSAPELLPEGVTGFLRSTVDDLVDAVHRVRSISRSGCRRYVEERFSADRMAQEYERIYERVLNQQLPLPATIANLDQERA